MTPTLHVHSISNLINVSALWMGQNQDEKSLIMWLFIYFCIYEAQVIKTYVENTKSHLKISLKYTFNQLHFVHFQWNNFLKYQYFFLHKNDNQDALKKCKCSFRFIYSNPKYSATFISIHPLSDSLIVARITGMLELIPAIFGQ